MSTPPPNGRPTLADEVLDGLTRPCKELSPKHLYDARGADLFDRICELPEYYPTRAERAILEARADAIAAATGAGELVELGSGSAGKTRLLLDAMRRTGALRRYVPFDVSEQQLRATAAALDGDYPELEVEGIAGDFEWDLDRIPLPSPGEPRIVAFLGGTIGNFLPGSRRRFHRALAALLGPEDHLLIGTDLVKDPAILEAALRRRVGGDGGVQPQPARRAQPRARRRLRPGEVRARRRLRPRTRIRSSPASASNGSSRPPDW